MYVYHFLIFFILNIFSFNVSAGDIEDTVFNTLISSNCSKNASIYSRCYKMDVGQCINVFTLIYSTCRQVPNGALIRSQNSDDLAEFNACIENNLLAYLTDNGFDLDAPCGQ